MSFSKILCVYISFIFVTGLMAMGCKGKSDFEDLKAEILLPEYDQKIRENEFIYFKGFVFGGTQPYKYNWHFGGGISNSSEKDPGKIVFNYEGAYKVFFTVTDKKGVKSDAFVNIIVEHSDF